MSTPIATSSRNLAQRIEALLVRIRDQHTPSAAWQMGQVAQALSELVGERFAQGESTMAQAERPDLFQPAAYRAGEAADIPTLIARLTKASAL